MRLMMASTAFPTTYDQWRHCITVECGIPLKPDYIEQRLQVLRNRDAQETARFGSLYGDDYLAVVLNCFERASREQGPVLS